MTEERIGVTCSNCGQNLKAKLKLAGHSVKCPKCNGNISIPGESPPPIPKFKTENELVTVGRIVQGPPAGPQFRCPYCGSNHPPFVRREVTSAGYICAVLLLFLCIPLFWIGFFIKEERFYCPSCHMKLR